MRESTKQFLLASVALQACETTPYQHVFTSACRMALLCTACSSNPAAMVDEAPFPEDRTSKRTPSTGRMQMTPRHRSEKTALHVDDGPASSKNVESVTADLRHLRLGP